VIATRLAGHLICRFSKTPLERIVYEIIKNEGPITIERYMQVVLHHPDYGYYSHGNPIGERGDFGTFPEISPVIS